MGAHITFHCANESVTADPRLPRSRFLLPTRGTLTAVGWLPASKPGLDAGAHDPLTAYRMGHRSDVNSDDSSWPFSGPTSPSRLYGGLALTGNR